MQFAVDLKQHSPIIHFQPVKGATLRATELKPKLDRLLESRLPDGYKRPFRYRLWVQAQGTATTSKKPHRLFFGNMNKPESKKKKELIHNEGVTLHFNTYFDDQLARHIQQVLPRCLAMENFGARQSKGFGSFYLQDGQPPIEDELRVSRRPVFYFDIGTGTNVHDAIEIISKVMKSGINETFGRSSPTKLYVKSLLWRYFQTNGGPVNWEKRYIKNLLLGAGVTVSQPKYLRALLGLARTFEFRPNPKIGVLSARMDPDYNDTGSLALSENFKVTVKHPNVERFRTPVTFKPVDRRVYLILDPDALTDICGQEFIFEGNCLGRPSTIRVPSTFDIEAFVRFVADYLADKNHLDGFTGPTADFLQHVQIAPLI